MQEEYDFVIFGTGLIESLLACELSKMQKKVLVVDENANYGSDVMTLSYNEIVKKFNAEPIKELEEKSREFNIDLIPKIFLVNGAVQSLMKNYSIEELVKFKLIGGSFLFKSGKLLKIPTSEKSSMKTSLVSFWEKPRLIKFFWNIRKYAEGKNYDFKETVREEFVRYGISEQTQEFIGHAIALNLDDKYLDKHPKEFFDKVVLYVSSIVTSKGVNSPYIFPEYGLSEISQFLSRVGSVSGITYRLNTKLDNLELEENSYKLDITDFEGEKISLRTKAIISNPSYFMEDIIPKYEIIRSICIIKGECDLLQENDSANVVFLSSDLKRKNDIFLLVLSEKEKVCPKNYRIAIISTKRETSSDPKEEISVVYSKLGNVIQSFVSVDTVYCAREEIPGFYIIENIDHTPSLETGFKEFEYIFEKILKL